MGRPRSSRRGQRDPHGPLGEGFPVDQDVFDDELAGEGGNRQVEPLQSAGGNAEDHPDSGGDETGCGNG